MMLFKNFFSNIHSIFLVNNQNLAGHGAHYIPALVTLKPCLKNQSNYKENLQEYHQCGYLSRPPKVQPPCLSVQPWTELHHGQHQTP